MLGQGAFALRQSAPAYNRLLPVSVPFDARLIASLPFFVNPLWSFPVFISSAFAQTAPAAAAGGDMQSSLMGMLPLVLMFVVLYFVMIRPQMKKAKEHKTMVCLLYTSRCV